MTFLRVEASASNPAAAITTCGVLQGIGKGEFAKYLRCDSSFLTEFAWFTATFCSAGDTIAEAGMMTLCLPALHSRIGVYSTVESIAFFTLQRCWSTWSSCWVATTWGKHIWLLAKGYGLMALVESGTVSLERRLRAYIGVIIDRSLVRMLYPVESLVLPATMQ